MDVHYLNETNILLFLLQVFILLLATRCLGEVFRKWNQPALTAEILIGVILGPTIFGRFLPGLHQAIFPADVTQQVMLETVAWIGVLFMLLETGLEIDFSVAWRQRGNALTIALSDIVIPMVIAFVPCLFLPERYLATDQRLVFALFMATVMTISAMPVAARVLHDLNLLKTDLGFLIMSALAVNDVIGWVLFTIVLGFFTQSGHHAGSVLLIFVVTVGFAVMALTLGRRLSSIAMDKLKQRDFPEPATSLTFVCLLGLCFGVITQKLGIHALFGFFIAGVVMGEAKNLSEETRGVISQMVYAIFVPLFFANIGLKIDFATNFDFFLVGFMCIIGIFGRYFGAWVGINLTKTARINRHLISIAHTPGGMMEIVVALLAYESGLITGKVFVAIVFSAVLSSIIMGPWMRRAMQQRAVVRISDILTGESVYPALKAAARTEAIDELSAYAARQIGTVSTESIAQAARLRESEFGTAIGYGVAIPHVRLEKVIKPVLIVARAPQGIDWNAPDGQPVRQIFFLVTPAGVHDVHVQILAAIARIVQNVSNRVLIDSAEQDHLWPTLKKLFLQEDDREKPKVVF
ncbi:MAG: cation:proton antiporter [Phycisphaerae bacterium]|nr:cation:proton antiporter [Phycisphaerae bacterium]